MKAKRETTLNLKLLLLTIASISLFATEAAQPILASLAAMCLERGKRGPE